MRNRLVFIVFLSLTLAGLGVKQLSPAATSIVLATLSDLSPAPLASESQTRPSDPWSSALITAARAQIGVTTRYNGAYVRLSYPNGDVAPETGVCTDVIIRALRVAHGLDLQQSVHEDMSHAFSAYPALWGLSRPDANIDHRRVPNLRRYFERHDQSLPISDRAADYQPGDLVTWLLAPGKPHIGIVSDRMDAQTGEPLILHNVGAGTREQRFLFAYPITGHYRLSSDQSST